jgi:capsular polysaccharide export protein
MEQEKPDLLVIWNGKKLPNQTVVLAAKQLSIPIYYFENGLLPGTTMLDPQGVNQAASIPKDPTFYLSHPRLNALDFKAPDIEQRAAHRKRSQRGQLTLPERFIFVPFQVPHDTQIACYSPWIPDMDTFYHTVVEAVKQLGDPALKVVFKEHSTWHKHYPHLYHHDPIAMFANDNVTRDIMLEAQAVITINSTVGLEALLLNKKVITLGLACFNVEGLVLHAKDKNDLHAHLTVLPNWQVDHSLRNAFFNYLQQIYCINGNSKDCDDAHCFAIEKRLTGQDEFAHGPFNADFVSLSSTQ